MVTKLTLINGYTVTRDKWLQSDPLSMMTKLHSNLLSISTLLPVINGYSYS